jgi:prepilin-type N-terminal cleavage/methylation domain-containing protein
MCQIAIRRSTQFADRSGFSLIELMVVAAILMVATAIAVPSIQGELLNQRAGAAMQQVRGQLSVARDTAMATRRTVEVQFNGVNQIQVIRIDGAVRTPIGTTTLLSNMQYRVFAGLPDTPDTFGRAGGVSFGGPTTVWFLADGSVSDAGGVPASGTLFLGMAALPLSARAVTVLGPTGRIQAYRWDGRSWR